MLHQEYTVCEITPRIMFWTLNGWAMIYKAMFDWLWLSHILTRSLVNKLTHRFKLKSVVVALWSQHYLLSSIPARGSFLMLSSLESQYFPWGCHQKLWFPQWVQFELSLGKLYHTHWWTNFSWHQFAHAQQKYACLTGTRPGRGFFCEKRNLCQAG